MTAFIMNAHETMGCVEEDNTTHEWRDMQIEEEEGMDSLDEEGLAHPIATPLLLLPLSLPD